LYQTIFRRKVSKNMTDFSHSLSLQATPINDIASRHRDGRFRRRCALARQASSHSRLTSQAGVAEFWTLGSMTRNFFGKLAVQP